MQELQPAVDAFANGDFYFKEENDLWIEKEAKLKEAGYTMEEVLSLDSYYKEQIRESSIQEQAVKKELGYGNSILREMVSEEDQKVLKEVREKEIEKERRQPTR